MIWDGVVSVRLDGDTWVLSVGDVDVYRGCTLASVCDFAGSPDYAKVDLTPRAGG